LLIKNSILYVIVSLIPSIVSFILVPFYLKYVSVEEFGVLSILLMINSFVTIFSTMQLHSSIVKFFVEYKENEYRQKLYLSSLLYISIVISIIVFILLYISINYLKILFELDNLSNKIIILSISISFINGFKIFYESINRIEQKVKTILVGNIISTLILIVSVYFMLEVYRFKLEGIILSLLFASIGALFFYSVINRKYFIFKFDFNLIKEPIKFAIALIPHTLSKNIYVMADRLILVKFVSMTDVGIYAIVDKVANIVKLVTSNFGKAFTPFFITNNSNNKRINIPKIMIITNYIFLGVLLGLTLISNKLLLFIKPGLESYAYLTIILSFAFIFKNLEMYMTNFLLDNKQTKYISVISVSSAVSNIILNLIFIPLYGIIAATVTTSVSYFIGMAISCYYVGYKFRYIKIPIKAIIVDTLIVSLLILIIYVNQNYFIDIIFFICYLLYGYIKYYKDLKKDTKVKYE